MIGDEIAGHAGREHERHAAATAQAQAAAASRVREAAPLRASTATEREPRGAYPGLATRALAYSVDLVLINLAALVVGVAVALVASVLHRLPDWLQTALVVALGCAYVVWVVGYFVFFWATTGQTPGCRVMHIRVIAASGTTGIGVARGVLRFVGIVLATIPLLAGFAIMLWDARRRCLQDRIARTLVVYQQPRTIVRESMATRAGMSSDQGARSGCGVRVRHAFRWRAGSRRGGRGELDAQLDRPHRAGRPGLQGHSQGEQDDPGDQEDVGSQHQETDPAENIGRRGHGRAQHSADHRRRQLLPSRVRRLDADQPRRHRDVADHHQPDGHAHRDREPRPTPSRHDGRRHRQQQTDHGARDHDRPEVTPRLGDRRPDLRGARTRDREGEHGVEEEAGDRDRDDDGDHRDEHGAAEHGERVVVEHVRLQVGHRRPDPDRGRNLHEQEPPVRDQQLQAVEEQREGAHREHERREHAARVAQAEDRLLDLGVVALLDRMHERADAAGPLLQPAGDARF